MRSSPDIALTFLRWKGVHAVFHRGYWLVASLYLVVDAELTAFQLVFIGTAQGVIAVAVEVPAGVVADTMGRKKSLVAAHVLMGTGMLLTGLTTDFPLLVATQMLWGSAWTFVSGADVAWVTDELDDPVRIDRVLAASARYQALGSACGLIAFGAFAWFADRELAIVASGAATIALGVYVHARFPERNFTPLTSRRWQGGLDTLRIGAQLARNDRVVVLLFGATFLVNGGSEIFGRLYAKRLVDLGFPTNPDPIVWYTALGIGALLVAAVAVRAVEARIAGAQVARTTYGAACLLGALGMILLAAAPDPLTASIGVLVVSGVSLSITRVVGSIWLNRQVPSDVRATVHSFLAQAEYLGEIVCGFGLAIVASTAGAPASIVGGASLLVIAGIAVLRAPHDRHVEPDPESS
jgi:MFS family permease|tara:strand:- start:6895 stop:8121 length:1227 start_codon:yes stop_codon:yes gene_type:complete